MFNMVATRLVWLFKFKLSKIKFKIQLLSLTDHISIGLNRHVASGHDLGHCTHRMFPSLQKVVFDSLALA